MIRVDRLNPIVIFVYYIVAITVSIYCMNPLISIISFGGFGALYLFFSKGSKLSFLLWSFVIFIVTTLINPIVNHNGMTVLFFVGNNGITLEALLYGVFTGVMILSVLFLSAEFSQIMNSEKILYCLGKLSPRFALAISMILKFIPDFSRQAKKIKMAARAQGVYKEDNAIDSIRAGSRSFLVLSGWALENGIITADSMEARGYGSGKRSYFSTYRFTFGNFLQIIFVLIMSVPVFVAKATGQLHFEFYPRIEMTRMSAFAWISLGLYGALVLLPLVLMFWEKIRWNYLKSRI